MSYELEPFGIRTVIIELGVVRTNFYNFIITAKRSKDPNSSYAQLMKGFENGMSKMIENGNNPEYVAEIVLDAITTKNPKLRYLAGKDIKQIMEIKNKMSDEEFHNMMKRM